jgi:hypothetical protein
MYDRRRLRALLLAGATLAIAGCANPNFIGVQDYGYIVGNVVDQGGKPIAGALVSTTGTTYTANSNPDGSFNLQHVATGEQTISVTAAGYSRPATPITVIVVKDQGVSAGNIALTSQTTIPSR